MTDDKDAREDGQVCDDEHVYVLKRYGDNAHDGAGWYYYEEEYPNEGSTGSFDTPEEAKAHAALSGVTIVWADYSDKPEPDGAS